MSFDSELFALQQPPAPAPASATSTSPLVGAVYARLTIVGEAPKRGAARYVICKCTCGRVKEFALANLRKGTTRSCGCYRSERVAAVHHVHGHIKGGVASPTYNSWSTARGKCRNPNAIGYAQFGAKGVTMCAEWDASFSAFLRDMGERPLGAALVLLPDSSEFAPGKCRWAPR